MLTIFSIESLRSGRTRDSSYLLSQSEFRPAITTARLHLLKPSSNSKITVRNNNIFSIFQFVCSPFFQLNCSVQDEPAIHCTSSHRPNFAPPPLQPPYVCSNQAVMQKNGKKALCIHNFTVLSLTIFSIKLMFLERTRDSWNLLPQTEFFPAAAATRLRLL